MVPCHHLGFEVLLVWYHALRSQSLALKLVELLVLLVWWCWIVAQSLLVVCVCVLDAYDCVVLSDWCSAPMPCSADRCANCRKGSNPNVGARWMLVC